MYQVELWSNMPFLSYWVHKQFLAKIAYWPHPLINIHDIHDSEFSTHQHVPTIYQQLHMNNEQIWTYGCEVIDILRIWPFDLVGSLIFMRWAPKTIGFFYSLWSIYVPSRTLINRFVVELPCLQAIFGQNRILATPPH